MYISIPIGTKVKHPEIKGVVGRITSEGYNTVHITWNLQNGQKERVYNKTDIRELIIR